MATTKDSLIQYPCDFPIKVMGRDQPGFLEQIAQLVQSLDPNFKPESMQARPSTKGNYISLTITVRVDSRAQLDSIYRALHGHEMVSVVL